MKELRVEYNQLKEKKEIVLTQRWPMSALLLPMLAQTVPDACSGDPTAALSGLAALVVLSAAANLVKSCDGCLVVEHRFAWLTC